MNIILSQCGVGFILQFFSDQTHSLINNNVNSKTLLIVEDRLIDSIVELVLNFKEIS